VREPTHSYNFLRRDNAGSGRTSETEPNRDFDGAIEAREDWPELQNRHRGHDDAASGRTDIGNNDVAAEQPAGPLRLNANARPPRNTGSPDGRHERVVEEVQKRLDASPDAMRTRRETVEHPFGTIKARMGATHFLITRLPSVASEMALHVLAYNLTRVLNIMGVRPLVAAIQG
jgi:hypothetical protein